MIPKRPSHSPTPSELAPLDDPNAEVEQLKDLTKRLKKWEEFHKKDSNELKARVTDLEKRFTVMEGVQNDVADALNDVSASIDLVEDKMSGVSNMITFLKRVTSKNIPLLVTESRRRCKNEEDHRFLTDLPPGRLCNSP